MRHHAIQILFSFIILTLVSGCANIVPPEGGKKDTRPPKLLAITPADSQLNSRITRIEMQFNEFIELNNPSTEVQVSPLLPFPPTVVTQGKKVIIKIPDSALYSNTTYRVYTGEAIKDLHEGNVFKSYTYTFSTGNFFDTLQLYGKVYNAATGLTDTGAYILLYDASKSDSIVVKEKPRYVSRINASGEFKISGLPGKSFKIYALHDANGNLVYDGKGEMIAFIDSIVRPVDSVAAPIILKSFKEIIIDTLPSEIKSRVGAIVDKKNKEVPKQPFIYKVDVDTSSLNKRVFDVTKPLFIAFDHKPDSVKKEKMFLSHDSLGVDVESAFTLKKDTVKVNQYLVLADWKEETVYTIRLQRGFARDSIGNETLPSKYTFRTKNDDDYGKLEVRILPKYKNDTYLLMISTDPDTVYFKPVRDTVVKLKKLRPGTYTMRIIVDKNKNGKWDTGDLFEKRQPEEVIPYTEAIQIRPGWDSIIDFEKEMPRTVPPASPEKGGKPPRK